MANKIFFLCLAHMSEQGLKQKHIKEAFDTKWIIPLGLNVSDDDVYYIKKTIA